jgi:crossover junction endodeoxyribonuclease RuvC
MRYIGIDTSTKTGFVILNEHGVPVVQKEIKPKSDSDPQRFIEIAEEIMSHLIRRDEPICIEGFSYGSTGKGVSTQYGLGWMIRAMLVKNGFTYYEVAPGALKKFATGKGNTKKDEMVLPIYKRWGFEHSSDNVRDAYVLAQIAKALKGESELTSFQKEVLEKVKP